MMSRRLREGRVKVDPKDDGRRRKGRYYRDSAAQDPTAFEDIKVRSPTAKRQVMVWHGSLRPLTSKPHPPVIWWSRCVIKDPGYRIDLRTDGPAEFSRSASLA